MNAEKERRDVAESRASALWAPDSISIPIKSKPLAKFMRRERRRFFRNFAWTWATLGREICVSRRGLRRSGGKIGRQIVPNFHRCVAVSPGCFSDVRIVLRGVYVVDADVAFLREIYFVPKRKASRIVGKLLKSPNWFTFAPPKGFRRCESAWSVDFDSANGSLTLF